MLERFLMERLEPVLAKAWEPSHELAYLAPDLTEQILGGRQPRALTLGALTSVPLPADWKLQRSLFQRASAT